MSLMGYTYAMRNDVEHLHENKHLEVFDRNVRLDLVKKLEMMEYIVRSALVPLVRALLCVQSGECVLLRFESRDAAQRQLRIKTVC
jgi:hypothetical protein